MGTLSTLPIALVSAILSIFPAAGQSVSIAHAPLVHHTKGVSSLNNLMEEYETKGNFAAWALHTFTIPTNLHTPLPKKLYQDVTNSQRYIFGQAVKLGLITPKNAKQLGVQEPLTKSMAAIGLTKLLHINTHGLSPYQFAIKNRWFTGTSTGATLRRKDMSILYAHIRSFLQASTIKSTTGSSTTGHTNSSGGTNTGTSTQGNSGSTTPAVPFSMPVIPASGELNLGNAPSMASINANTALQIQTAYPNTQGQSAPVQINSVIYSKNSPNLIVTGYERKGQQPFYPEVWVQINELGTVSGTQTNQWQYPVMVNPNGSFSYALHVPFAADSYEVQAAPPLTTAQTSLTYTFDTNHQTVSKPITLTYKGQDSNQQLGMLTSVWANYTDPKIQALAKKITAGATKPLAMAQAVYNWEGQNIGYNGNLLANNGYGWSTTEETLASKVGICVDYANVADAFLRSLGIPTQMVVGYANDTNVQEVDNGNNGHAWNRSWIGGKWVYFDPTWSRVYFLSSSNALPNSTDLWAFQPQWFNPPTKLFTTTHQKIGIQDQ